ncbi:EamA family transporter [Shewanella sp. VB17]|uniref:DMT family transporter n=1 Tax=Shewanella sp. VB17 TaxID=2739432 RepID=UPI001566E511|nr:EamA family transporter [Shewanella sp. VB17]NRD74411.1 EamA family transporter [Shewanella sp. VB17]
MQPINSSQKMGSFAILMAAFLWGTTGTVATFAPNLNPLAIGAAAMGGGGLLQAFVVINTFQKQRYIFRNNKKLISLGVVSVFIYPLAFYSSMHLAGVAIGTVVSIGTAPLASAIIETLFDKSPLSKRWLMGFIIGTIGIILLSIGESHHATYTVSDGNKMMGIFVGVLAGITYALYSWTIKGLINAGVDSPSAMGVVFGLGGTLLLPTLLFTGDALFQNTMNITVVAYMILVPMFIGYVLFGLGLRYVSVSVATTLTLFEPLVAALLAVFVVGENINLLGCFGIILIFICIALLSTPVSEKK